MQQARAILRHTFGEVDNCTDKCSQRIPTTPTSVDGLIEGEIQVTKLLHRLLLAIVTAVVLSSCAQFGKADGTAGRWIQFDATSQRYSIDAQQVQRGALLNELNKVAGVDIRSQPEHEGLVTAHAKDLDLDTLVSMLLPPGTRTAVRLGEREIAAAVPGTTKPKQGAPVHPAVGAVAKPDAALEVAPEIKRTGALKAAAETAYTPREVSGPSTKPQAATLLRTAEAMEPKKPLATRVPRATVRLQFLFEEGAPPRLIDARAVEGRAPAQRFVTGSYLFVVMSADSRVLEAGTFQDPLIEHSYLPEGQHSVGRAPSGIVGISIGRENLSGAVLRIVDLTGVPMPRELDERIVRTALERGKPALQLETATILRRLEQETK